MVRRIVLAVMLLIPSLLAGAGDWSFSATLGYHFFNYQPDESYLNTGITLLTRIGQDIDLDLGIDVGLTPEPRFFVPVSVGLNFDFPVPPFEFYLGFGLTPVFRFLPMDAVDPFDFCIGPYGKIGAYVRIHQYMQVSAEIQQDLLIGEPGWINTATRVNVGVRFSLPSVETVP